MTILEKFRSSIRRGTGEAVLIMQLHPGIDFSKEIMLASTRIYAYDPQCEGSRGYYLSRLIDLTPKKNEIVDKILDTLNRKRNDDWELRQMFNIARIYAQQGNEKARQIMYKVFKKNLGNETELLDLDGIKALKFIAHVKGKAITDTKNDEWEDDWLIRYMQTKIPKSRPMRFLMAEAKHDPYIQTYIDSIKKNIELSKKYKKTQYTYETVKTLIDNKKKFGPHVGKRLKKGELTKLAADLISESDNHKIELYLKIFHKVKYPSNHHHLLHFAVSRYRKVRINAIEALSHFSNSEVRKFALDKIKTSKHPEDYFPLLKLNYHQTDSKLILQAMNRIRNKGLFHGIGIDVLHIYENNKTKTCRLPLIELYNRTYCHICRESAVRCLLENGVLSKQMQAEVKFDSYVEAGPLQAA